MSLFFGSGSFTSLLANSTSIRPAQRMLDKTDTGQEVYMLNQNDVREKFQGLKGNIQNFFHKFHRDASSQADGVVDTPQEEILSDGSSDAQKLVWENEQASLQDKSYSFDEESTDADYDFEDSLEFEDDTDTGSGQEARYR